MLQRVRAMLDAEPWSDGYNIGTNDGAAAGQTVNGAGYAADCACDSAN